jgi:hypothetical protein
MYCLRWCSYCPTILTWHFINFRKGHLNKHLPVSIEYIDIFANFTRHWCVVYWYRCRTTDLKVSGSIPYQHYVMIFLKFICTYKFEIVFLTYQIETSVNVTKTCWKLLSHMGLSHTQRAALLKTYTYAIHSYKNETWKGQNVLKIRELIMESKFHIAMSPTLHRSALFNIDLLLKIAHFKISQNSS